MKKSARILIGLLVLIAAVVIGWKIAYPTNSFRYKVTVNVETPEGMKSGSAVREIIVKQIPKVTPEMHTTVIVRGEAVAVDLGKRGVLFALIGSDDELFVLRSFPSGLGLTREGARYYEQLQAKTIVDPLNYPLLVAFKDIADPKTVEAVYRVYSKIMYPKEDTDLAIEDNLEKTFGKGVKLKDITVEMTDEKVTWDIEERLSWLDQLKGSYLNGNHINGPELYDQLHGGNFKVGEK